MTTNNELREGNPVRIKKGRYQARIGEIALTGHDTDGTPLYLVTITVQVVYKRDEIERVESEVGNG